MSLRARDLHLSFGSRPVLRGVSLEVHPGEVLALVGPNGAGKTTLLRLLSGALRPDAGAVTLLEGAEEQRLDHLGARQVARRIGVVEQEVSAPEGFTVEQVVSLGRLPHLSRFQSLGASDHHKVAQAMDQAGLGGLGERTLHTLSSGERQRVYIAMALAQEPRLLFLDEPTAHLDVHYQVEIFRLVRALSRQGLGVLMTVHDLNLAALADRVALLAGGALRALGPPAEVLGEAALSEVFGTPMRRLEAPRWPVPLLLPGGLLE